MSEADIADAIRAFADAALTAKRLGFDAVELHGAHGYLIDQFFWEGTNRREDAYGGKDLPGRARFAADIVHAVRSRSERIFRYCCGSASGSSRTMK
jgi:2,4-dienoyl-CoA reductase-like NADH-dependent reductase (Old Yellow Enzyme family)